MYFIDRFLQSVNLGQVEVVMIIIDMALKLMPLKDCWISDGVFSANLMFLTLLLTLLGTKTAFTCWSFSVYTLVQQEF